jgi:hypothetical protein
VSRGTRPAFASPTGPILQVKMRLIGISPMIWRRVLLPVAWTLEELHGAIQAAMGWEGLHLYEFRVRSARYGSPELRGGAADVTLESLRFRRNAKLTYIYDMGDRWEHEIRIEDRLEAEDGRRYPRCVGGHGACPPEDCGGPEGYEARREEAASFEAFEDLDTMASLLKAIVLDGRHELLEDEDTRWELDDAVERSRERQPFLADGFSIPGCPEPAGSGQAATHSASPTRWPRPGTHDKTNV